LDYWIIVERVEGLLQFFLFLAIFLLLAIQLFFLTDLFVCILVEKSTKLVLKFGQTYACRKCGQAFSIFSKLGVFLYENSNWKNLCSVLT